MEELFIKIKRLREARNLNQIDIAKEIGISSTAYSKIEKGITKSISVEIAVKIAKALNLDFNELFDIESRQNEANEQLQNEIRKLNIEIENLKKRASELEDQLIDKKQLEEYFKRDIFELRTIITIWPKLSYDTEIESITALYKEKKISKADYEKMLSDLPDKLAQSIVLLIKNNVSLLTEFERELKATKYQAVLEKVRQQLNQ